MPIMPDMLWYLIMGAGTWLIEPSIKQLLETFRKNFQINIFNVFSLAL